ncbi:MAG: transcriptional regulator [Nitrospira bacterium HGW-Nitrospira-1]|nr:MAG: transcriptional regulator [Nitrospira bacterium HGW-Nitrospira-1]
MPDRDVVLAKVAAIQRCLRRIKDVTGLDPERLDNINTQDIVVLNLQMAVEAAIDLATHIIASEGLGLASTIRDHFRLLKAAGIIDETLLKKMEAMVGFRNIAIHDYQSINIDILKSILSKHLKDLEELYSVILSRFSIS